MTAKLTDQQRQRNQQNQLVAKVMKRYGITDPAEHIKVAYPSGIPLAALRVYQIINRSIRRDG